MALTHKPTPSLCYAAGLAAVYLGERVLEPGRTGTTAAIVGVAAVAVAVVLGLRQGKRQAVGRVLPLLYGLGLLALALHFSRDTLPALFGHRALEVSSPKIDGALSVLWPAVMLASTLPVLLVELALAGMARAPVVDSRRVHAAMRSGLGISFALIFCFAIAYVAAERNIKADLSFFRTARASVATKKVVAALDKPVEVTLFYPPGNEVAEELASYFADLARASAKITVNQIDQAVEPGRAKALGVSSNGAVAIARGTMHEQLQIPVKLESARPKLRTLDQDVHKRILTLSRGKRIVYRVQGHEEKGFTPPRDGEPFAALSHLRELLQSQNLETRDLGLAQGLGNEVPADAAMVLLVGPQRPMLAEETAALLRYFQRGGRLLVAADPDTASAAAPVLKGLGLELSETALANDRIYWARTHQKSDRTGIAPATYATHAALATLAPFGAQMPIVMSGAGALTKVSVLPSPAPTVDLIIHTDPSTWDDKNGNLEFDQGSEQRKAYAVAAAVTLRKAKATPGEKDQPSEEGRAFVLGDSDALSDLIIINRANAILTLDAVRWLLGETEVSGITNNEEDMPVRHTRKQDVVWFYSSVFLAPILVLLAGWAVTHKRRKRDKAEDSREDSREVKP
jgi:hypothetical protein